jgi:hypothetical protein
MRSVSDYVCADVVLPFKGCQMCRMSQKMSRADLCCDSLLQPQLCLEVEGSKTTVAGLHVLGRLELCTDACCCSNLFALMYAHNSLS